MNEKLRKIAEHLDRQEYQRAASLLVDEGLVLEAAREGILRNHINELLEAVSRFAAQNGSSCDCSFCENRKNVHHQVRIAEFCILVYRVFIYRNKNEFMKCLEDLRNYLSKIYKISNKVKGELSPNIVSSCVPLNDLFVEGAENDLIAKELRCIVNEIYRYLESSNHSGYDTDNRCLRVSFPLVIVDRDREDVVGVSLELTKVKQGDSVIYPDPVFFTKCWGFDKAFLEAIQNAWNQFYKVYQPEYAVRWRIVEHHAFPMEVPLWHKSPLVGNSVELAAIVGLVALHSEYIIDPNCFLTGHLRWFNGNGLEETPIECAGKMEQKLKLSEKRQLRLVANSTIQKDRVFRVKYLKDAFSYAAEKFVSPDGKEMILVKVGEKKIYVDKYVVTVEEYERFLEETHRQHQYQWEKPSWANKRDMPATNISVSEARAYAEHYGKRLPTMEEAAAFAVVGNPPPRFPWGDKFDKSAFIHLDSAPRENGETIPVPVYESRSRNAIGIYVFGNVEEYVVCDSSVKVWGCSYKRMYREPERTGNIVQLHIQYTINREQEESMRNWCVGFRCVMDSPEQSEC